MLDVRIASALLKIIQNSHFKKKVSPEEQKAQKEDQCLRGRQIAFMIYDYFRVTGAHDTVLDYADLFSVTPRDDIVQEFDTRWDEVSLSMSKIPSGDVLESLYKLRIRESDQLKTVLELHEMETHQNISMPDDQKLKTLVTRSIDQKLRLRNFDARHGKNETGAVVKSRKGSSGVERGRGTCYQWKEKGQCPKGDQCSFPHESDDRAPKPTPKAAPPSEPSMTRGRSVSRKRSVRDRSQTGRILRQPCRCCLKGTCPRPPWEYWHPPECQFYKTESGCKAGDKCLFPHCKVEEQPSEKQKKSFHNGKKRRQGCCGSCENCTSIGLCLAKLRAIRTSEKREVSGKPRRKVLGSIRRARLPQSTPRQASIRENEGPSPGKIHVKMPHQRSPYALKFGDRSQEETQRQER